MNEYQLLNKTKRVLEICTHGLDELEGLTVLLGALQVYLKSTEDREGLKQAIIEMLEEE